MIVVKKSSKRKGKKKRGKNKHKGKDINKKNPPKIESKKKFN